MSQDYQRFSGKTGAQEYPIPKPDNQGDKRLLFGGMDFAKRVHTSALEIFELEDSTKLNDSILVEKGFKVWEHVNYKQISIDTHKIYPQFPMFQIPCFYCFRVVRFTAEPYTINRMPHGFSCSPNTTLSH